MGQQESTIRLAVGLPRVVFDGGTVAHVLYQFTDDEWGAEMVCHHRYRWYGADDYDRWATPDDPTCRRCLAKLKKWVDVKEVK